MRIYQHQLNKRPFKHFDTLQNRIKSHSHKVSLLEPGDNFMPKTYPIKIYYHQNSELNKLHVPLSPNKHTNTNQFFLRSSLSNHRIYQKQKETSKSPLKDDINEKQSMMHSKSKQKKFDFRLYKDIKFGEKIKNKNKFKTAVYQPLTFNKQNVHQFIYTKKTQNIPNFLNKPKSKCPSFLSKSSRSSNQEQILQKQQQQTNLKHHDCQLKNIIASECPKNKHIFSNENEKINYKKPLINNLDKNVSKHTISLHTFQKCIIQPMKCSRQLTFPQHPVINNKSMHTSLRQSPIKPIYTQQRLKQEITPRLTRQPTFEKYQPFLKKKERIQKIQIIQRILQEEAPIKKQQNSLAFQKKRQSILTVQDIKQALIDCDLFSSDDCESVLKNHSKDIYKKVQKVKFQQQNQIYIIQDKEEKSCSPQSANTVSQQRLSPKKSKWLLSSTDIIKQSLKQLSEYNTQRQIQNKQKWENITIKKIVQQNLNNFVVKRRNSAFNDIPDSSRIDIKSNQNILGAVQDNTFQLEDFQLKKLQMNQWRQYQPYLAQHKSTNFICIIRQYTKQSLSSNIINFIQQMKIQMHLQHPNIQKVYGVFCNQENIYSIHEFTQEKLSSIIKRRQSDNKKCCPVTLQAQTEIQEIVSAVQCIHLNNIAHRLIRPQSVFSLFNCCKVSQFINCSVNSGQNSYEVKEYMCPQLLFDNSKTSMDIWSLGVLTFEILTGKTPFGGHRSSFTTTKRILQGQFQIPQSVKQISSDFMRICLKRNPTQRGSIFDLKNTRLVKQKDQNVFDKLLQKQIEQILQN